METSHLVAGESREVLLQAVRLFRLRRNPSGTCEVDATLPWELADPFLRALDRVEEQLERADREQGSGAKERTKEQRRADAFVLLVLDVLDVSLSDHS